MPTAASDVYSAGVAMAKAGPVSGCVHAAIPSFGSRGVAACFSQAFMGVDLQVSSCLPLRAFQL